MQIYTVQQMNPPGCKESAGLSMLERGVTYTTGQSESTSRDLQSIDSNTNLVKETEVWIYKIALKFLCMYIKKN